MSASRRQPVILVGPPGAGCSSAARALAALRGTASTDLAEQTAARLGVEPELALVMVPEAQYRRVEEACALRLIAQARAEGTVVALGSGCLSAGPVRTALAALADSGGRIIALTASTRRLASRNGLDAPRSVALGTVHHEFTLMLHAREAQCRQVADRVVDTTDLEAEQVAALLDSSGARQ